MVAMSVHKVGTAPPRARRSAIQCQVPEALLEVDASCKAAVNSLTYTSCRRPAGATNGHRRSAPAGHSPEASSQPLQAHVDYRALAGTSSAAPSTRKDLLFLHACAWRGCTDCTHRRLYTSQTVHIAVHIADCTHHMALRRLYTSSRSIVTGSEPEQRTTQQQHSTGRACKQRTRWWLSKAREQGVLRSATQ